MWSPDFSAKYCPHLCCVSQRRVKESDFLEGIILSIILIGLKSSDGPDTVLRHTKIKFLPLLLVLLLL